MMDRISSSRMQRWNRLAELLGRVVLSGSRIRVPLNILSGENPNNLKGAN
jgi:hypothetical protein